MTELTYTMQGDYQIPNLTMEMKTPPISRYGRMHQRFLRENRRAAYNSLLLSGKLHPYLTEIDRRANAMLEKLTQQMAKAEGVTESLKASDQMSWIGQMNNIRSRAEELVLNELIYR